MRCFISNFFSKQKFIYSKQRYFFKTNIPQPITGIGKLQTKTKIQLERTKQQQ